MSRPGTTPDRKFLNVLISAEVIQRAKAAAALEDPPKPLNHYVEEKLIAALTKNGSEPRKARK